MQQNLRSTPNSVFQKQVAAYNARDLPALGECFAADIKVFDLVTSAPRWAGKDAVLEHFKALFQRHPGLKLEIIGRTELGEFVVNHERLTGVTESLGSIEVTSVNHVKDGQIQALWLS